MGRRTVSSTKNSGHLTNTEFTEYGMRNFLIRGNSTFRILFTPYSALVFRPVLLPSRLGIMFFGGEVQLFQHVCRLFKAGRDHDAHSQILR